MSSSQHNIDLLIKKLKKKKGVANIKHDPVVHCTKCLRPKIAMGCESFVYLDDPILDDNGRCLAYVDDEKEYERLKKELR